MAVEKKENHSSNRGEKGSTNQKSLILAVLLIVVIGIGGYLLYQNRPMPQNLSGVTLDPNCKYNDPDLCRFLRSFSGIDNIKAISTSKIAGKNSEVTMINQGAKTQLITKVNTEEISNYITSGQNGYIKDYSDKKWWKFTAGKEIAGLSKVDWKKEYEDSLSGTKLSYKKVGTDSCGSLTCLKYQVTGAESNRYIWFDTKNYMLRKNSVETNGTLTETLFSYNNPDITEPTDTKTANSQADISKSMAGGTPPTP